MAIFVLAAIVGTMVFANLVYHFARAWLKYRSRKRAFPIRRDF